MEPQADEPGVACRICGSDICCDPAHAALGTLAAVEGVPSLPERRGHMDWASFLEVMLVDEHGAEAKYRMASRLATDPRVKEILEQLRYEEEVHVSILEKEAAALRKIAGEK